MEIWGELYLKAIVPLNPYKLMRFLTKSTGSAKIRYVRKSRVLPFPSNQRYLMNIMRHRNRKDNN
jgi:hypothetical protein